MDMLPVHRIDSTNFYYVVNRYLRSYTSRFIREFQHFAISPYEMDYYDRECVYVRQRNNFNSQFNVSMSGDDAEEVQVCNPSIQTLLPSDITRLFSVTDEQFGNVMCSQVIPNPTDFSARPWIDVNDLNTAHHQPQPSSSGVYSPAKPSRYPFFSNSRQPFLGDQPSVSTNQQSAAVSHTVINISDSENDDCVIIEEKRMQPETIVLDDSDQETTISDQRSALVGPLNCDGFQNRHSKAFDVSRSQTSIPQSYTSTLCMPSTSYHSAKLAATSSCSSLDLIKTYCKFEKESDVIVEYHSNPSCSRSCDKRSPTRSSSVLSTDISSDETNHGTITRSKKKRSRRFYKSKHRASSEPTFLSASSSTVSDKDDEDWEERQRKQRKKVKKNRSEKHEKKIYEKKRKRVSDTIKSIKKKMPSSTTEMTVTVPVSCRPFPSNLEESQKENTSKLDISSSYTSTTFHYPKIIVESNTPDDSSQRTKTRLRSVVRKVENPAELYNLQHNGCDQRIDLCNLKNSREFDRINDKPSTSHGYYRQRRESPASCLYKINCSSDSE